MPGHNLYQLAPQSHTQMMSYVIQTSNGHLIVIDGGTTADAQYLLQFLKRLSKTECPVISAWFLTHAHSDHINAMMELFRNHINEFKAEKIYYHFPHPSFVEENEKGSFHSIADFEELLPVFKENTVIVSEGDSIQVDEALFEILYTTDSSFKGNALNNSSTVIKMTLGGCTAMFLGDLGVEGGEKLLSLWHADKLHCDMVEMAHHGQSGVDFRVYEAINPTLCMWCTPQWLWDNNQGNRGYNSGPWKIMEVRHWMDLLGVNQHIIAKDGTYGVSIKDGCFSIHKTE